MATFEILDEQDGAGGARQITLRVSFGDQSFTQLIVSSLKGDKLAEQLQAYSDQYEADWNALQPPALEPVQPPTPEAGEAEGSDTQAGE